MEDRDPIKQLQHLLDDPGKVLEKISRIQSALGSINTSTHSAKASPATSLPSTAGSIVQTDVDNYSTLLQTLRDMQVRIEECLLPLALQAAEAEAARLNEGMEYEQHSSEQCLAQIDQNILACVKLIHESQRKHSELSTLKERLEKLGASPSSLPEISTSQDPSEIIKARLESLRRDGKI